MDTKYCPDCHAERYVTEFYINKAIKSGYSVYCKTHQLARDRAWRDANREKFNAYMREYQAMLREQKRQELARKEEAMEQAEQLPMFTQRTTGPTCNEPGCKAVLHSYEIGWKKCVKHHRQETQAAVLAQARLTMTQITAAHGD